MKYKRIVITGGAGFIGSNIALFLRKKYPRLKIIALDNLKRRGSELTINRLKKEGVLFVHADIRNAEDLHVATSIDLLIECSAEPSVMAGYGDNPYYIINTNLQGTVNCLELVRKNNADIIFLSTSRAYPFDAINAIPARENSSRFEWKASKKLSIPGWSLQGIDVNFPLEGARTLYGATKLCSELLIQEYIATYDIRGVINRCGVIAGPWQFGKIDQGVFTLWMLTHYFKKQLEYIGFGGQGKQVRDVLHIDDFCNIIDLEMSQLPHINNEVFNIGGGKSNSLSLKETTHICEQITGSAIHIKSNSKTRPGDIKIFITDNQRVIKKLGWKPLKGPEKVLEDIYSWISENEYLLRSAL